MTDNSDIVASRPKRRRAKKLWVGSVTVVVVLLAVVCAICWHASDKLLYPGREALGPRPKIAGATVQDVAFKSSDGVAISGWFIPATCGDSPCANAKAVVLSHGRNENRSAFSSQMPMWHKAGLAVLAFDYRGCGDSGDAPATVGANEQKDLDAAVDFALSMPGTDDRSVAVVGRSMGAAVAVLSASHNAKIGAVVDDSGFARLSDVIAYNFKKEAGLPAFPFAPITIFMAEHRAHVDVQKVAPVDVVSKIAPRPVLLIHSTSDTRVRYDQGAKVAEAAGDPHEVWKLDGVAHVASFDDRPTEYEQRVVGFVERSLGLLGP